MNSDLALNPYLQGGRHSSSRPPRGNWGTRRKSLNPYLVHFSTTSRNWSRLIHQVALSSMWLPQNVHRLNPFDLPAHSFQNHFQHLYRPPHSGQFICFDLRSYHLLSTRKKYIPGNYFPGSGRSWRRKWRSRTPKYRLPPRRYGYCRAGPLSQLG